VEQFTKTSGAASDIQVQSLVVFLALNKNLTSTTYGKAIRVMRGFLPVELEEYGRRLILEFDSGAGVEQDRQISFLRGLAVRLAIHAAKARHDEATACARSGDYGSRPPMLLPRPQDSDRVAFKDVFAMRAADRAVRELGGRGRWPAPGAGVDIYESIPKSRHTA